MRGHDASGPYNVSLRLAAMDIVLNRLGTVLGTVGGQQLSSWREVLKILSNFDTVRWPRG